MINLVEKLKDCPKGTKLYSSMFGEVELVKIETENFVCPIIVRVLDDKAPYNKAAFTAEGKCFNLEQGECLLFPSKDNRDWNEFRLPINTLKPFDKVLVRDDINDKWIASIFGCHEDEVDKDFPYVCINGRYCYCIPYEGNEHLLNTTKSPKDY